ncbi:cyclic peptide export ABC transporter [Zhouia spongiae]|uniref:Cyclic peptide export ABC transporter n=1 Tax=Zhouia spongiae TaxID=2202721 RepID=A0ABY3YKF5_9FLAO|nr:cyclic peptide export ABC transporter [Zhouia spongiae]UNY98302.1 cyclic peptide export ABC transporter [Zhouia spongiae]
MLKKIKTLTKISNVEIIAYSLLSMILGITSFSFVILLNSMIELLLINGYIERESFYLMTFIGIIALFFTLKRVLSGGIINLSQEIYWNVRKTIINQVLKAPLRKIIENKDQVYSILTRDVGNITSGSLLLIDFVSSIVLVSCCFFYMAYISLSLFLISFTIIFITVGIYLIRNKKSHEKFNNSRNLEKSFIRLFNSILNGTKEINLNPIIGQKLSAKIGNIINNARSHDKGALIGYLNTQVMGQILFYFLITFIVFYSSSLLKVSIESSISYIIVLMYMLGPIGMIMTAVPVMNKTFISLNKLNNLMTELEIVNKNVNVEERVSKQVEFNKLEFENYCFSYGKDQFSIGPINLNINKGEVVFIYGGNGSGKTTLFNTILNIYHPNKGKVKLNDELCNLENLINVKSLFSPVFSDFYLFEEMYGIDNVDTKRAQEYLRIFEIDKNVTILNNKFSTIDLSVGQRKRLALINALLENKPIIVLDEWAADQDPIFRQKFYKKIIPYLLKNGFTILAVTHDDKYYNCADRLYKMEYGHLIEVKEIVTLN